jgi:transposase
MARRRIGVADIKAVLVAWDAGERISAIERMLGYTRPTVRKYIGAALRLGLVRGERPRSDLEWETLAREVQVQLAKHQAAGVATAEVAQWHAYLAQHVPTTYLTVLYQRLRDEQGLRVSWATFYRYVEAHWPERVRRTRPVPPPTVRLPDPPPGEEAQVDFFFVGRWTDPATGQGHRLSAFLMTLAHSRHQFLYPVLGEDERNWLAAHVAAFTFFGGAPRRLVPDNLSAGIRKADRYDPRVNRAYSELTRYYGCLVDPARVRHPKDKPRVERGVAYARESFFRGRSFTSVQQMRAEAVRWAREVAGQRIHGTTRERPWATFQQREQAALLPLPPAPWELATWTTAVVQADCHLCVARAHYSVPYRYVGQRLDVRLGERVVSIYDGATLVTSHPRQLRGRATRLEHYPPGGQTFLRATPQVCLQRAQAVGPATTHLVETLLAPRLLHLLREAQAVLRLTERWEAAQLEAACAQALAVGDGRYRTVRGLVEHGLVAEGAGGAAALGRADWAGGAYLRGPDAFAPPGQTMLSALGRLGANTRDYHAEHSADAIVAGEPVGPLGQERKERGA